MSKESYIRSMISWAKAAENKVGLPYYFIVAQWGWETGWGANRGAKSLNNHAGIKYSQYSPAGTTKDGMYAKYPTMNLFIEDYARVYRLSYYTKIKAAKTDLDRIKELNASAWSEADYNINTMLSAMKLAREYGEGITAATGSGSTAAAAAGSTSYNVNVPNVSTLTSGEVNEYAAIGLALTVLVSLMPKGRKA